MARCQRGGKPTLASTFIAVLLFPVASTGVLEMESRPGVKLAETQRSGQAAGQAAQTACGPLGQRIKC